MQTYIQEAGTDKVRFETGVINGKIGLAVTIQDNYNKSKNKIVKGDINATKVVLFGLDIPQLTALQNDTKFVATHQYEQLSQIAGAKQIGYDGTSIQFNSQGKPSFIQPDGTSIPVHKDVAITQLDRYEGYNQVKDAILAGNPNSENMLSAFIIGTYGYQPNTAEFTTQYNILYNKIIAEQ